MKIGEKDEEAVGSVSFVRSFSKRLLSRVPIV